MLEQRVLCEACHSLDICQPPCERDETRRKANIALFGATRIRRRAHRVPVGSAEWHARRVVWFLGYMHAFGQAGEEGGGGWGCEHLPSSSVCDTLILSIPDVNNIRARTPLINNPPLSLSHTPIVRMICISAHASKHGSLCVGGLNVDAEESASKHIELDGMFTLAKSEVARCCVVATLGTHQTSENLKTHTKR
jgi:hypothetical protein